VIFGLAIELTDVRGGKVWINPQHTATWKRITPEQKEDAAIQEPFTEILGITTTTYADGRGSGPACWHVKETPEEIREKELESLNFMIGMVQQLFHEGHGEE